MDGTTVVSVNLSLLIYLIIRLELLTWRVSRLERKIDNMK